MQSSRFRFGGGGAGGGIWFVIVIVIVVVVCMCVCVCYIVFWGRQPLRCVADVARHLASHFYIITGPPAISMFFTYIVALLQR